jgi:class 3 adenylate cyclase
LSPDGGHRLDPNDLPEDAVVYGHAAGDTASVAGLVDTLASPVYYDGREATVDGNHDTCTIVHTLWPECSAERGRAGDGFFATFDSPGRAIRCARAIIEGVRPLGLDVHAGAHTGECEVAAGKVAGIAVVVGARVAAFAASGQILATSTVKDLVAGSELMFTELGEYELKGVPERWSLYVVV